MGQPKTLRHIAYVLAILCIVWSQDLYSQSVFTSNLSGGTGDWDDPASWTENNQGNPDDSDGIPDSDDDVVISATDIITLNPSGTTTIVDLTVSGTLDIASNNRTLAVTGNLVMSGTSTLSGNRNNRIINVTGTFNVSSGASATIAGIQVNITGTTTLDGALAFTSTTGNKTFNTIDVNASGTWNNSTVAEDFVIDGNIINDGTWNGCSNTGGCTYDFTSATATVSGSSTVTLADINVDSPGALTNNGTILLTDDLVGSGSFTNGATGDFQIQGTGPFSISTLDLDNVGNTVTYTNVSNTTMITTTYHNIVIAKDPGTRAQLASTITVNNDVTVTSGEFRINAGTANISGDLMIQGGEFSPNNAGAIANITGDLNMSSGTYDMNNGDVNVTGDLIIAGGTMTMNGTGSTVDVDDFTLATGTVTLTQGILSVNNVSGGVTVNSGSLTMANAAFTLDIDGTYTVAGGTNDLNNGTLNVANWTVNNSATVLVGGVSPTVTGTTTINGTFTVDANGGTKTLNDINVSSTGNWNVTVTEGFTINGDIDVDGTWTDCSSATGCVYVLTNSSGTISGTSNVEFSDLTIDTPASYTSSTSVIITDELIGTGTFINGNGSTLELSGAGPFSITTLDATTNSNTVTYSGGSAVTVNGATYHNLTINKSAGVATISSAVTVNNDLTVSSNLDISATTNVSNDVLVTGGILEVLASSLDVTNNLTIQNGEFTPNDINAIVNVGGNLSMSDGLFDHNDGDVTITGDLQITGGTMTVNQGTGISTFNMDDFTLATGTVTLSEGEFNINSGTGGMTVSSGSLTLAGTAVVVTNDITINGGTNDYNAGSLSGVDFSIATGQTVNLGSTTFTSSGNTTLDGTLTVDNNGGTKSFGNITVNGTGNWNVTSAEAFDISGNITNNGTWTGCPTNGCDYTLTSTSGSISGTNPISLSDLIINTPASYTNSTSLSISDRFTGTGTFTNAASSSLSLGGATNDISNFTTSATGTTVTYNRVGGDQGLNPTTDGQYYNLVISTDAAGNDVTMSSSETITNQLTLSTGDLFLGGNTLTIEDGATIIGGGADGYIGLNGAGVLRQNYSSAGTTLSFPLGDGNDYSPITTYTINSGTFGAGAYVEFDLTDANLGSRNTANTGSGGDDDGTTAVDYISRYWTLTGNNISSVDYNATYVYVDADVVGTIEGNMVGTVYRTPPGFGFNDWGVFGTVNPLTNTVTVNNVDEFGILFAMDNTGNRLPISLLSFEALERGNKVVLNWATATEINNDFFTIQRSSDGTTWNDILTVDGAGNSEDIRNYTAQDIFPLNGRSFYRLKQTDFDGSFTFSEVSSVYFDTTSASELKVFPNPALVGQQVTVGFNTDASERGVITLLNMKGQIIMEKEITGNQIELNTIGIQKGVYLIVLKTSKEVLKKRLVIN